MNISHKIELKPNNKTITYFKKAFGCARFAYNWALAKHKEYYEKGIKKSAYDLSLSDRVYKCDCGLTIDRDYNASLNLYALIEKQLGEVLPEYTPADLSALLSDLITNQLVTSKVDTEI